MAPALTPPTHQRKKPGKIPKSLLDRVYKPKRVTPIQRPQKNCSRERKIEVLMWIRHHRLVVERQDRVHQLPRVPAGLEITSEQRLNGQIIYYRPPNFTEASKFWNTPIRTIKSWWKTQDEILEPQRKTYRPAWPKLEDQLYEAFLATRQSGKLVTVGWFRRTSKKLFAEAYPDSNHLFTFSRGWFTRFLARHDISRRRVTKTATKLPGEYVKIANSFLRFIRRVSQPSKDPVTPAVDQSLFSSPTRPQYQTRHFPRSRIINLDETPIPFEYLDGYTYDLKGEKTIGGKSDRSGWNKRQATLILYIWGDGELRIKPKLIFHGSSSPNGKILKAESNKYSPDITVEVNETAYNNEELFKQFIEDELIPAFEDNNGLLVMDVASFHCTQAVMDLLRQSKITTALIPPGCTSFLQPLDTAINKPFKQWLREAADEYIADREERLGAFEKWSVSDKRIMTTWIVAIAAKKLYSERKEMVQRAFVQCGITIRPDGTQDDQIKLKDIPATDIDFSGWETAYESYIKQEDHCEIDPAFDDIEEFTTSAEGLGLPHFASTRYTRETAATLKKLCGQRGLKKTGKKVDLIRRLEAADREVRNLAQTDTVEIEN